MIRKLTAIAVSAVAVALLSATLLSAAPAVQATAGLAASAGPQAPRHPHHWITGWRPATTANRHRSRPFCSAGGEFAICATTRTFSRPRAIWMHVTARPAQRVAGTWTLACSAGEHADSSSGSVRGSTPVERQIAVPGTFPDSCTVSADAQLVRGGHLVRVWLTATR